MALRRITWRAEQYAAVILGGYNFNLDCLDRAWEEVKADFPATSQKEVEVKVSAIAGKTGFPVLVFPTNGKTPPPGFDRVKPNFCQYR